MYCVYKDKDFIKAVEGKGRTSNSESVQRIAKEFGITPWDVFYFETRKFIHLGNNIKRNGEFTFDPCQTRFFGAKRN